MPHSRCLVGCCRDGPDAVPSSQPLDPARVCFSFVFIQRANGTGNGGMELNGFRAGGTGRSGLSGTIHASALTQAPTNPMAAGGTAEKTPIKLKYQNTLHSHGGYPMPAWFQDTPKSLRPIHSPFPSPGRALCGAGSACGEAKTHELCTGSDRQNQRLEHGWD